jgi:excisionase family DNA binding protein
MTPVNRRRSTVDDMFAGRRGIAIKEAAEFLGVSEDLVRTLLHDGELVGWRVKSRIVISTASIEEFLDRNPY